MSCSPSFARESAYLGHLTHRVSHLEGDIKAWQVILGDVPGPQEYAVFLSAVLTNGTYVIKWASEEGRAYQIQESTDGEHWFITAYAVEGGIWTVGGYAAASYFRILTLPTSVICCSLPDDPEDTQRFFEGIIGPTGGGVYGGCSDCAGDFPYCDDPLAELI